jgi:hypothetical protein
VKREFKPVALLFSLLVGIPAICLASIQQQRAQIAVNITINVTPNPLGYAPGGSGASSFGRVIAKMSLNRTESAKSYRAEALSFDTSNAIAQNQGAIKAEAEVSPNPLGTLLYSNSPGVVLNQEAGTTVVYPCAYTVTVSTTQANWSLDHGLFTDMELQGGNGSWTGHDIANNSYLSTPHPTATPFIVYSDGQNWTLLQANGGTKSYCVDLTVTIPISTPGGTYSSNAVYTLLY